MNYYMVVSGCGDEIFWSFGTRKLASKEMPLSFFFHVRMKIYFEFVCLGVSVLVCYLTWSKSNIFWLTLIC